MATVQVEERVRRLEGAYPALAMSVYVVEPETRAARRFAKLRAEIAESETRAAGRFAELRTKIAEYEILSTRQIIESRIRIAQLSTKSEIDMAREFGALRIQIAEGASSMIRWMLAISVFAVAAVTVFDSSSARRGGGRPLRIRTGFAGLWAFQDSSRAFLRYAGARPHSSWRDARLRR